MMVFGSTQPGSHARRCCGGCGQGIQCWLDDINTRSLGIQTTPHRLKVRLSFFFSKSFEQFCSFRFVFRRHHQGRSLPRLPILQQTILPAFMADISWYFINMRCFDAASIQLVETFLSRFPASND